MHQAAWSACVLCLLAPLESHPADPPTALEIASQLNDAFVSVVDRVSPAVVVIRVVQKEPSPRDILDNPLLENLPPELRRYLDEAIKEQERLEKEKPKPDPSPPPSQRQYDSQGSGVIVRQDGYILTNNHVVENAEQITVRFRDATEFRAVIRGRDPKSDLAVVKIDRAGLPSLPFADSTKTRVGEFAIAIGAPFELDYSVTFGHVSAIGRSSRGDRSLIPAYAGGADMDQDFVQTDASINPGNSGGPLVNLNGQIIGINSLIHGINRGIGFAIPANLAQYVANQLIDNGRVTRGWLGVQSRELREHPSLRETFPNLADGVFVDKIVPDSPASRSSLKPKDIILKTGPFQVKTVQQLRNEIRNQSGNTVNLTVFRDGQEISVPVKIEPWPEDPDAGPPTSPPNLPEKGE